MSVNLWRVSALTFDKTGDAILGEGPPSVKVLPPESI